MIVEVIGGPHDGKTIRVEDGMRVLAVPVYLAGAIAYGTVYYPIEPHPLTPDRGAIYGPLLWPGAE
jgi:hypothetical protein